jgi:hypothetical protein
MDVTALLNKCDELISDELKKELKAQGHYNTGKLESNLDSEKKVVGIDGHLIGTAPYYALILHHGYGPEKATWKSFPALIEYFQSKGKSEGEAKQIAAATIRTWMKGGMPTPGSYAYSTSGERLNVIEIVNKSIGNVIDKTMSDGLDNIINDVFHETKSETI